MVPVGGAIIAGFDSGFVSEIAKTYPGKCFFEPIYLFIFVSGRIIFQDVQPITSCPERHWTFSLQNSDFFIIIFLMKIITEDGMNFLSVFFKSMNNHLVEQYKNIANGRTNRRSFESCTRRSTHENNGYTDSKLLMLRPCFLIGY